MAAAADQDGDSSGLPAVTSSGGTLYLILIQVASRFLTFFGNQFLLRFLSRPLLGIAAQLELYSVLVLYFSRESIRVALQRQPLEDVAAGQKKNRSKLQAKVNLSYLAIALSLPTAIGCGSFYLHQADVEAVESPYFKLSLQLYGIAAVVELFAEPAFVILQQRTLFRSRARTETFAAVTRSVSSYVAAVLAARNGLEPSVLPLAIGQLSYAVVVFCGYFLAVSQVAREENISFLIKSIGADEAYILSRFSRPLLWLSTTLYAQSIFKIMLTKGDEFILSLFASLPDLGDFSLASNYGGLLARLLLQPIEEGSRNVFGKLLSPVAGEQRVDSRNLDQAMKQLYDTLHFYGLFTIGSMTVLSRALPVVVRMIVGPRLWSAEIGNLLSVYCYYLPFMAYNGILDAFVTSVATPAQLWKQFLSTTAFTAFYAGSAYVLLHVLSMGARGLVIANIFSMVLGAGWSVNFINKYLALRGTAFSFQRALPQSGTVLCGVCIASTLLILPSFGENLSQSRLIDLIIITVTTASAILIFEHDFLISYLDELLPERLASKIKYLDLLVLSTFKLTASRAQKEQKES